MNEATSTLLFHIAPTPEQATAYSNMMWDALGAYRYSQLPLVLDNERKTLPIRRWSAGMVRHVAWNLDGSDDPRLLAAGVRAAIERVYEQARRDKRPFGQVIASSCDSDSRWLHVQGMVLSRVDIDLDAVDWVEIARQLLAQPSRVPMRAPLISGRAA